MKKNILLFLLLIVFTESRGQIMTPVENATEGSWWVFRKTLDINKDIEKASMRIAADTKYWLWINGKQVVFEGGLKRGPNPQDTYIDIFDHVDGLKKGKNTIAVLVWYLGKSGFSHRNSGHAGLFFELTVNNKKFTGDNTWKVSRHPAYYVPEGESPNFRLSESNIGFDASMDIRFTDKLFNDSKWNNCRILSANAADWNNFIPRPIPQWKDSGLKKYTIIEHRGDTLIAHLPYNAQITPYLKVTTKGIGKKIDIRTDNYHGGSAPNVRAEYISKEGQQEYESLGWMNGHYVMYLPDSGVEIQDVMYRETGYDTEFTGSFTCNNDFFNTLWQKAQRTLYITMRDSYMDCPDRERAQWWGDVVNELGETFYSLDAKSHMLTRKAIYELMNWQRPDSTIYSPIPDGGSWNKELPMQMLASVGYYGFWTYYMGSGDKETIVNVLPNVKRYLSVWTLNEEGLVNPRSGNWDWGDWGKNIDMEPLFSLWYSIALNGYEKMAELANNKKEIEWAKVLNNKIKRSFHNKYWKGKYYMSDNYKGLPDDRVQALAIVGGFLPVELYPIARTFFKEQYHASPYMEKYVLEALCVMGYHEDALERMKKRFDKMVSSPLTTLWEGWGIGAEGFGGGTYNHAWSGGGLTILSQYIAGIEPVKPAFKEFSVKPVLAGLTHIESITPTIYGQIILKIEEKEKNYTLDLTVPESCMAYLKLPDGYHRCIVYHNNIEVSNIKIDDKLGLKASKWRFVLMK